MIEIYNHIDSKREEYLDSLMELLRQPSISTRGEGMEECTRILKEKMENIGIATEIIPTPGHPVVYGYIRGRSEKTLLI